LLSTPSPQPLRCTWPREQASITRSGTWRTGTAGCHCAVRTARAAQIKNSDVASLLPSLPAPMSPATPTGASTPLASARPAALSLPRDDADPGAGLDPEPPAAPALGAPQHSPTLRQRPRVGSGDARRAGAHGTPPAPQQQRQGRWQPGRIALEDLEEAGIVGAGSSGVVRKVQRGARPLLGLRPLATARASAGFQHSCRRNSVCSGGSSSCGGAGSSSSGGGGSGGSSSSNRAAGAKGCAASAPSRGHAPP
jgi:uncharacterized membrane protein YgcG